MPPPSISSDSVTIVDNVVFALFLIGNVLLLLKVSKFQRQIFLFSFEPKNERNHFLIFAERI